MDNENSSNTIRKALINRIVEIVYQKGYNPEFPQGIGNLFEFSLRNEEGREVLTVIPNKNLEAEEKEKIKQYGSKEVKAAIYDIERVWYMPQEEYEKHIREVYTGDHLPEWWFSQAVESHKEKYEKNEKSIEQISKRAKEVGLEKALKEFDKEQRWLSQFIVMDKK